MPLQHLDISFLRKALPEALPDYLRAQRWFGSKARTIESVVVWDVVSFSGDSAAFIAFITVAYQDGASENYALPLVAADETGAAASPSAGVPLHLERGEREHIVLQDALGQQAFCSRLLQAISRGETLEGERHNVAARPSRALARLWSPAQGDLKAAVLRGEQSNTSVNYGDRLIFKFFRKIEPGVNPDLEIGFFLTERTSFSHIARTAGSLELSAEGEATASLGILQEFIPNQGDAWKFTLASLVSFFERVSALDGSRAAASLLPGSVLDHLDAAPSGEVESWVGSYLEDAELLATRTAELHAALASDVSAPAFAPEPFVPADRTRLVSGMDSLLERVFSMLRERSSELAAPTQAEALKVAHLESVIRGRFQSLGAANLDFKRVRIHGDYHLGQVLRTENDFVIIDFEGEPARPLAERRARRSPLQDVAGMVRSFHYAVSAGLAEFLRRSERAGKSADDLQLFARLWYSRVSTSFLSAYLAASRGAVFLPRDPQATRILLQSFLLEKAVYELGYELNNRPDWVGLPLRGILDLIESI